MKTTSRSDFKYITRTCKHEGDISAANSLANKLLTKDEKSFWTEVKKINHFKIPLANCIDDVPGSRNIGNQWKTDFSGMLNSSKDSSIKEFVLNELNNVKTLF